MRTETHGLISGPVSRLKIYPILLIQHHPGISRSMDLSFGICSSVARQHLLSLCFSSGFKAATPHPFPRVLRASYIPRTSPHGPASLRFGLLSSAAKISSRFDVVAPWFMGLLPQPFRHSLTSAWGIGFPTGWGFGFWYVKQTNENRDKRSHIRTCFRV